MTGVYHHVLTIVLAEQNTFHAGSSHSFKAPFICSLNHVWLPQCSGVPSWFRNSFCDSSTTILVFLFPGCTQCVENSTPAVFRAQAPPPPTGVHGALRDHSMGPHHSQMPSKTKPSFPQPPLRPTGAPSALLCMLPSSPSAWAPTNLLFYPTSFLLGSILNITA